MFFVYLLGLLLLALTIGVNMDTGLKIPVFVGVIGLFVVYALQQLF